MAQSGEFSPGVPLRPQRVSLQVPVRYRPLGEERWHAGRTENLSQTGVLIRVARLLPVNTKVELTIKVPAGILSNLAGDLIFTGGVTRFVPPLHGGGSPGIAIAFETWQVPKDSEMPTGDGA